VLVRDGKWHGEQGAGQFLKRDRWARPGPAPEAAKARAKAPAAATAGAGARGNGRKK
jgi:hypothetical protein